MPPASDTMILSVPNSVQLPLASDLPPLHKRVPREVGEKPHVAFHQVQVRRFPMIAGDNPACMLGVPVTIDWGYEELPPLDLNAFETIRQNNRRRKVHHLLLSCLQRQRILLGIGYSDASIAEVEKDVEIVRYQRHMTRLTLPFFKIHDLCETLKRKLHRKLNGDVQRDKIAVDTAIRELRRQDYMLKSRRDVQKRALSTGLHNQYSEESSPVYGQHRNVSHNPTDDPELTVLR
eukprot:Nitzschia sp. Nitz4//scaffold163_size50693//39431//40216//NITZ4_006994-RA/size50693-snap-gene-0.62-mRNA-1//1//CDS//3329538049//2466//frame0